MELAKIRMVARELAGKCAKKLDLIISMAEFVYDTVK